MDPTTQRLLMGASDASGSIYIEDVFSTWLYAGNNSTQTITNGIDLSGKGGGGLVWIKSRSAATDHQLFDTARGATKELISNSTAAEATDADTLTAFNSDGFALGADSNTNTSAATYASWTFRKAAKFFDVVTYTGDGVQGRNIAHNLGSAPGCIIIKCTSTAYGWIVYHRSLGAAKYIVLSQTGAETTDTARWNNTSPTSTQFTVGNAVSVNELGQTYVAYLFAHDAGGFGDSGTESVIKCGSYNDASAGTVTLGWEPQFVLYKLSSGIGNWQIVDNMRGFPASGSSQVLYPNATSAESGANTITLTPTGFSYPGYNTGTYIYIAIRRGPMKTPTSGTEVFYANAVPQANFMGLRTDSFGVPFSPDLVNTFSRNGTDRSLGYNLFTFADRLRGLGTPNNTFNASAPYLIASSNGAENAINQSFIQLKADGQNITRGSGWNQSLYGNYIFYFFRRAPGFFDVVAYTGTGTTTVFNHSLGVVPEMMIIKNRYADPWVVYHSALGNNTMLVLNINWASITASGRFDSTTPTATTFRLQGFGDTNGSPPQTYINYLFATCPGVSKVGSYTGTGTTLSVDCGFTSGARFVLIKRTDSTGDWYVWDTARGIVSGDDSYLLLNSTAAEVTNTDYIDPLSSGFEITSSAPAAINASGGSFIFFAVA